MKAILFSTLLISQLAFADFNRIPFNKAAFEKSQENNEKIMLQVYASWCPVCKNEDRVFNNLKDDEIFKKVTYYQAQFDTEAQLKKEMNVMSPGTIILFNGKQEMARSAQVHSETDLKNLINKLNN